MDLQLPLPPKRDWGDGITDTARVTHIRGPASEEDVAKITRNQFVKEFKDGIDANKQETQERIGAQGVSAKKMLAKADTIRILGIAMQSVGQTTRVCHQRVGGSGKPRSGGKGARRRPRASRAGSSPCSRR